MMRRELLTSTLASSALKILSTIKLVKKVVDPVDSTQLLALEPRHALAREPSELSLRPTLPAPANQAMTSRTRKVSARVLRVR